MLSIHKPDTEPACVSRSNGFEKWWCSLFRGVTLARNELLKLLFKEEIRSAERRLQVIQPDRFRIIFGEERPVNPVWISSLDHPEKIESTRLNSSHVAISYAVF